MKVLTNFWDICDILHEVFDVVAENLSTAGHCVDNTSQEFFNGCISVYLRLIMHKQIEVRNKRSCGQVNATVLTI